jgi:hypothetical protein
VIGDKRDEDLALDVVEPALSQDVLQPHHFVGLG